MIVVLRFKFNYLFIRCLFFFCVAFGLSISLVAAQGIGGTISGTVKESNGNPVTHGNVVIEGTSLGSLTNENGSYSISNVSQGNYTITFSSIGFLKVSKVVKVDAGQSVTVDFILEEKDLNQLDEVTIGGERNKFYKGESDYVARMPLKNLENPQVYSVISNELMKEQVVTDVKEALRNAPGSTPVWFPSGGVGVNTRGFLTGINARNGMETVTGRSSVDFANIERIEVIKGPSGTLFGSSVSSFGGVVNLVTKKPYSTFGGNVSYTLGSFGLNRLQVDFNSPLNKDKTVLFRLNTAVHRQNSFLNYGYNNTFLFAPSFAFKVNDRFTILTDVEYFFVDQTRNIYSRVAAGTGYKNARGLPLKYDKTLYASDANAITSTPKFFVEGRYKISDNWTSSTVLSYVAENVKQSYQYYNAWIAKDSVQRDVVKYGPIYNNYTNFQQNINGEFKTGFVRHRVLVGLNYRFYKAQFNYSVTADGIDTININNPYSELTKSQIDNAILKTGGMIPWAVSDQSTYSAYATDVLNFTNRLALMLSLRVDQFSYKGTSDGDKAYNQTAFAPKTGLVYGLIKDKLSVFGNYMSGFENVAPIQQPPIAGGGLFVPKPVYAKQAEAGIKAELFDKKLTGSLSYYNITIANAIRRDNNNVSFQDAKQVSKGVEAELILNLVEGLNIITGYTYNDNRLVKSDDPKVEGNKASDAPENMANFWVSYKFQGSLLKNFGLGFGGYYVDKSFMSSSNTYYIPSYKVFNAAIFYEQARWSAGVKINNIASEKHWDVWGTPQALINCAGNLTFKF